MCGEAFLQEQLIPMNAFSPARRFWSSVIPFLGLTLISQLCLAEAPKNNPNSAPVVSNLFYRSADEERDPYLRKQCVLDLSVPQNATGFPTVIWFHGGGLTGGSKQIPAPLLNQGFAVAGVGYRLTPHVKVTDCIDDAAAAVSWVLKNIESYGGDPKKVIVSGHSAGGYLTMMIGLDPQWMAKHGTRPDQLAGLAPFSGQTITHAAARHEKGMPNSQPFVDELAPLFHIRKDAPPLLLLVGDREKELFARYDENAYLARMLKIIGHPDVTLIEYPGTDHNSMVPPGFPDLIQFVNRVTK